MLIRRLLAPLCFFLFTQWIRAFEFGEDMERKGFTMQSGQLDHVYKRAAIIAVLKAKAKLELQKLPSTESVLFEDCETAAKTPVDLAKCVVPILNQRDRRQSQPAAVAFSSDSATSSLQSEESWLSSAFKLFKQPFAAFPTPPPLPSTNAGMEKILPTSNVSSELPATAGKPGALTRPRTSRRHRRILKALLQQKFRHAQKLKYTDESLLPMSAIRIRRAIREPTSPRCETSENIVNLREVERYFEAANECMQYVKQLGIKNSDFLNSFEMAVQYKNRRPARDSPAEQLKAIVNQAESHSISLFSPKILNVLPSKNGQTDDLAKGRFFSPTLLSFHDEGVLPIPQLLKKWVDLIMHMTGSSRKLKELLSKASDQMKDIRENILPKIREFKRQEALAARLQSMMSVEQKRALEHKGYAHMNTEQMQAVYGEQGLHAPIPGLLDALKKENDQDSFLEHTIREMAEMQSAANLTELERQFEHHRRRKRQAPTPVPGLLAPFAFVNSIAQPSFLLNLVLSPHAFINELLSPQALTGIVLTPEALLAVILSPRALEGGSGIIAVSRQGMVRVLSPASGNVVILSPTILGANAASKGEFNIEVLSPSILVADDNIGRK